MVPSNLNFQLLLLLLRYAPRYERVKTGRMWGIERPVDKHERVRMASILMHKHILRVMIPMQQASD